MKPQPQDQDPELPQWMATVFAAVAFSGLIWGLFEIGAAQTEFDSRYHGSPEWRIDSASDAEEARKHAEEVRQIRQQEEAWILYHNQERARLQNVPQIPGPIPGP